MLSPLTSVLLLISCTSATKVSESSLLTCDGLIEPSVLTVEKPLEDVRAARGATLLLRCSFYGAPQPSITWYHRGRRVDNQPAAYYETLLNANQLAQSVVESALRIDCLDERTVGEYFCEATSPCAQPVVSAASVTLSESPPSKIGSCKSVRRPVESPPIISLFTTSRIELPSGVAQLMCRVAGNPAPTTKWMKIEEDESLSSIVGHPSYMHLSNGDLLIVGDEDTITESFRCIAENPLGSVHQDATVVYMSP